MSKKLISALIILSVILIIIHSLDTISSEIKNEAYENNCKIKSYQPGDRNIILRIDDIQAYVWRDIQIKMVEDALKRNKPVVLGVIPLNLQKDRELLKFLKENKCDVEIALHGYDNSEYEFDSISYKEADEKIKKGLKELEKIGQDLITFIPPNNEFSEGAEQALYDNGFSVISSGFWNSEYGFSVSTYDWKKSRLRAHEDVLADCKKDLEEYGQCIIMIHPQDYATDSKLNPKKYQEYIGLLEGIDELDAETITFRDFYVQN